MNKKKTLLNRLIKRFLLETLIWTICAPFTMILMAVIIDMLDFQWLYNLSHRIYYMMQDSWFFGTESPLIVVIAIWIIGELILSILMIRRALKYVQVLADVSEQMFDKNVKVIEMPPELEEIQQKMNYLKWESENNERMAREAEQRKNDLVVYLAHDLKTPLTSVIGYLTLLRDEKEISETLRTRYETIALNKAERLEDLINEFFEITRFNLSNITLEYSRVNLSLLLQQLVYEFKPMLAEKNLTCSLNMEENQMIKCDVDKMQRVFDNLLRNAVNYSFNDKEINIRVEAIENSLHIYFTNYGNTIPEEKLSRLFEQFFRLDSSRGSKTGGSGLGLAIAKQIVELHHGTISAKSANEVIEFEVVLPL